MGPRRLILSEITPNVSFGSEDSGFPSWLLIRIPWGTSTMSDSQVSWVKFHFNWNDQGPVIRLLGHLSIYSPKERFLLGNLHAHCIETLGMS